MSGITDWVAMVAARVSPAPTAAVSSDLAAIGSAIAGVAVTVDATLDARTIELRDATAGNPVARYSGVIWPEPDPPPAAGS